MYRPLLIRAAFVFATCLVAALPYEQAVAEERDPASAIILPPSGSGFFSRRTRPPPQPQPSATVNFPTAVAVPQNTAPTPPEPPPEGARPPYEKELTRLAEILGSVHYLRELCGANEGTLWRDQMNALLQAEEPGPQWRAFLVQSFNNGYRGFQRTYRQCTPSATLAAQRYMDEGSELTLVTRTRYAN
ncbi:MAG: TIGR02301 family protein [Fimbriimonadaceae bacterium]|nr:TIGR02301 family protein [Alphaproteobacteria bacterium]